MVCKKTNIKGEIGKRVFGKKKIKVLQSQKKIVSSS